MNCHLPFSLSWAICLRHMSCIWKGKLEWPTWSRDMSGSMTTTIQVSGIMGCQGSLGIYAWLCTKINSVFPVLLQRSRPLLIIMFSASEVGVYSTKIFYCSLPQPLYRSSSLIMFLLLLPENSLANHWFSMFPLFRTSSGISWASGGFIICPLFSGFCHCCIAL